MKAADRLLLVAIAAVLVLMIVLVAQPGTAPARGASGAGLEGEPRDVDLDLLRRKLLRGELSDREAMYYR